MSREYTEEEVRASFLEAVRDIVQYWENESRTAPSEKPSGVAFSILVLLDGGHGFMPGFVVAPSPHPDDKEYNREHGENWFPENHESNTKCDIAGALHELYHQ